MSLASSWRGATKRSSLPLLLVAIWAALLIQFVVLRPRPYSFLFWLLVVSAMCFGGSYMLLSHFESRRVELEVTAWLRKLDQLVDVHDFEDDGHLAEYLDESERRRVLEELERMPSGARSLRRAIGIVSPDLLGNGA
jgi:hypothetical protein